MTKGRLEAFSDAVIGHRHHDHGAGAETARRCEPFLRNPMPSVVERPHLAEMMSRRIRLSSEILPLNPDRLRGWGFAQAVLAAVWSIEDHGSGWEEWMVVAEALQRSA